MSLEDELAVAELEEDEAETFRLRVAIDRRRIDDLLTPIEEGIEYDD